MYQDVSHGFDLCIKLHVSTRVGVNMSSSCAKPDSGVTLNAVIFVVTKDTDPSFTQTGIGASYVEAFFVTIGLQQNLLTNQRLPRASTQWDGSVLPVSDQRVQRVGLLVDDNEVDLLADLHAKANLREGCVPVGR